MSPVGRKGALRLDESQRDLTPVERMLLAYPKIKNFVSVANSF
jgi:hypothetical protein